MQALDANGWDPLLMDVARLYNLGPLKVYALPGSSAGLPSVSDSSSTNKNKTATRKAIVGSPSALSLPESIPSAKKQKKKEDSMKLHRIAYMAGLDADSSGSSSGPLVYRKELMF
ncbi:hypothetical protein CI109_103498 [Kwoniella shandongensis]|uniref:Uncharacterized protein n=1 Tax=Kwoniella shandongensis TaxID=1734106 RepID=A0AAJ8MVJ2_9TREE